MVPPSILNSMKIRNTEIDVRYALKSIFCIGIGTLAGLIIYGIFLYFRIAIYGWNLGLIFAPLTAGYVETILANRIVGENVGAVSAFILFLYTTYYSFILKNPTLGVNLITAGSIIVILQAAFPTLINYILLTLIGGILSMFVKGMRKIIRRLKHGFANRSILFWDGPPEKIEDEEIPSFDENKSNETLNNLGFYFITSTDIIDMSHDVLGMYQSQVVIKKDKHVIIEEHETIALYNLKKGKDECLIKLSDEIKSNGGNGIMNLEIQYLLEGVGGESYLISATGMGICIH